MAKLDGILAVEGINRANKEDGEGFYKTPPRGPGSIQVIKLNLN